MSNLWKWTKAPKRGLSKNPKPYKTKSGKVVIAKPRALKSYRRPVK